MRSAWVSLFGQSASHLAPTLAPTHRTRTKSTKRTLLCASYPAEGQAEEGAKKAKTFGTPHHQVCFGMKLDQVCGSNATKKCPRSPLVPVVWWSIPNTVCFYSCGPLPSHKNPHTPATCESSDHTCNSHVWPKRVPDDRGRIGWSDLVTSQRLSSPRGHGPRLRSSGQKKELLDALRLCRLSPMNHWYRQVQ